MKHCKACEAPLVQRPGERPHLFARRIVCNKECAGRWNGIKAAERHKHRKCKGCNAPLIRRDDERASNYLARSYCCATCSKRALSKRAAAQWRDPELRDRMSRRPQGWHATVKADWERRQRDKQPVEIRFPGASSVEAFLAAGGAVTKCPTKFVAPSQHLAVHDEEAEARLRAMPVPEGMKDAWRNKRNGGLRP